MNPQILKLAQKSGATVNQGFDGTKNFVYGVTMSPEELDKFAQLIVRECSKISEDDITDGDACCTNTAYRIARQIKRHFGVE
jgi:hypothetical protein